MKLLVVLTSVLLVVSAITEEEQWQQWKLNHNKVYKSAVEDQLRFDVFKHNLKHIETHNERYQNGKESYFMSANKFADLTNAEFKKMYLNYKPHTRDESRPVFERAADPSAVPDSIDWREKGAVLEVKDQGQCGSCWAFSATGSLEGQNFLKHNETVSLSEQELVDCSGDYQNAGCDGGWMDNAFQYIQEHGISTEADYRYTARDDTCKSGTTKRTSVKLTGFTDIKKSEEALRDAVGTVGPIAVAMYADFIQFYTGGIFDNVLCGDIWGLDHGVLAVGYGTEGNTKYWVVKNSWGANWGEKGYFRLIRDSYKSCGIADAASYPLIA